jgi:AraC-like DNA-binding protein
MQRMFGLAESGPGYREFAPPPQLRRYVACLWRREARHPDIFSRVVPDGCIDIIWLGDDRLMVAGPATRAIIAESQQSADYVGMRFPPGVAPSFLDVAADALIDRHVPLDHLWPRESRELLERAAGRGTAAEKIGLLQTLVQSKLSGNFADDELVRTGIGLLTRSTPPGVGELSDTLLLSERQLRRRFRIAVGYGPKTLHRILRFQRALSFMQRPPSAAKLVDVATTSGYADQPHMVRDFVQLAGLPPIRLMQLHRRSTSDSFKKEAPSSSYDRY